MSRSLRTNLVFVDSFVDIANQSVMLPGRKRRTWFEFSWRFGPVLVDMRGDPIEKQPIAEDHPFWEPFNAWLAEYEKKHPNPFCPKNRQGSGDSREGGRS